MHFVDFGLFWRIWSPFIVHILGGEPQLKIFIIQMFCFTVEEVHISRMMMSL
jgi:hypothetical protein